MRVHWTINAVDHLINIYEHISLNSPTYAKRMVDRITRRSEQIARHPRSGRMVPEHRAEDIRELFESPYRIIYRNQARSDRCPGRDPRRPPDSRGALAPMGEQVDMCFLVWTV